MRWSPTINFQEEFGTKFEIKQCFTASYHPASNDCVELTNRKILGDLCLVVCALLHTWEDCFPHVAVSINKYVCKFTDQSFHFILFGVENRFSYDWLSNLSTPVHSVDDYVKCQLQVFSDIH